MSSKGKHRPKDEPKHTPKQDRSMGQTVQVARPAAVNTMPRDFAFLWTIDSVIPTYDERPQDILKVGPDKGNNNITKLWYPPRYIDQFRHTQRGKLYRWRMGRSERVEMERPKKKDTHDVASVFFQARTDNFVITRCNCERENVKDLTEGWGFVAFHHHEDNVSEVDYVGRNHYLAAPAPNSAWMPQVLPEIYKCQTRGIGAKESSGDSGGLCGKLAILIGMAAFSAEEEFAEEVVSDCFGLGFWNPHPYKTGTGRYQGRGVIVSIYLDPAAKGITTEHLKAFERGKYGSIWAYKQPSRTPAYTTTPPAAGGSVNSTQSMPRSPGNYPSYALAQTSMTYNVVQNSATHTMPPTSIADYTPTYHTTAAQIDSAIPQDENEDGECEEDIYGSS